MIFSGVISQNNQYHQPPIYIPIFASIDSTARVNILTTFYEGTDDNNYPKLYVKFHTTNAIYSNSFTVWTFCRNGNTCLFPASSEPVKLQATEVDFNFEGQTLADGNPGDKEAEYAISFPEFFPSDPPAYVALGFTGLDITGFENLRLEKLYVTRSSIRFKIRLQTESGAELRKATVSILASDYGNLYLMF